MPGADFLLLLNESLLSTVVSMPAPARRRFREKLEFLGAGLWDAGVRVKKLRGLSSKVVFEARLSRGDRLLFTLGRDRERSLVYVWDLVDHDEVNKAARRAGAPNAPFLAFEPAETVDHVDLALEDLGEEHYSQEPLEAKVREEYGPQKWLLLDDTEWDRLLRARTGDDISVHLYLTREQQHVLETDPPLLLSGTAGSGKTTICVYYLLRPQYMGLRRLFVTYSSYLRKFSERVYQGLVRHTNAAETGSAPEFLVFRDLVSGLLQEPDAAVAGFREFQKIFNTHSLCRGYDAELVWEEIRSIIKGAKPALSTRRLRHLAKAYLERAITPRDLLELQGTLLDLRLLAPFRRVERLARDYEGLVRGMGTREPDDLDRRVLTEALEVADKRGSRLEEPLLSYDEYAALGAKRAPNFRHDRRAIYGIAEYYQERLRREGVEDDVDRARRAIERIARFETRIYDLVVCDEVQDLCDLETTLLLRLARSTGGLVLAGDLKQTINPSGFRWEEVRRGFYERRLPVPEVVELGLNFRCVGSIVRLANALLRLKQRLVGLTSSERPEDWKFNGRPPVLLAGPTDREVLPAVDLGVAGRIVITRTREEKDRLRAELGSELVFTIYEAKGLEFDTVLLWRFVSAAETGPLWRRVTTEGAVALEHEPRLRHELNLLYVALTRARNGLVIYDGEEPSPIWAHEDLRDLVYRSTDAREMDQLWQHASTPQEWERQGEYFAEREHWAAAEECYRNAGNASKAEVARARGWVAAGRHSEAAELFARNGLPEAAAQSYEAAQEPERAMALWKSLGQEDRYRRCRVRLYEQRGEHERAAEEWEKLGDPVAALRNWELARKWDRVGAYWLADKKYGRAAEAFQRAGLDREAAAAWEKAKDRRKAADLYFRARVWDRAAALYRRIGDGDKHLECLKRIPDYHAAAVLQEKRGDLVGALDSLRRFAGRGEECVALLRREYEEGAARRLGRARQRSAALRAAVLGEHEAAAKLFEQCGQPALAYDEWRFLGDYGSMARVLAAQGKAAEAAHLLEQHEPAQREAIRRYLRLSLRVGRAVDQGRVNALWTEAERLEAAGDLDRALSRFSLFGDEPKLLDLYLRADRDEEAMDRFLEAKSQEAVRDFLERKSPLHVGREYLRRRMGEIAEQTAAGGPPTYDLLETHARLFRRCLDQDEGCSDLAENLLDLMPPLVGLTPAPTDALEDLAIRLRHCGALLSLLHTDGRLPYIELPGDKRRNLLPRIRQTAEATGDRTLLACVCVAIGETDRYHELLENIEVTSRTVRLFEVSPHRHARAAAYHLAQGSWKRAAVIHAGWGEREEAAAIHDAAGDPVAACRLYREAKDYERALECARKASNDVEIARAYEGLGDYGRAVDVWSALGRKKDVARVKAKLSDVSDGEDRTTQLDLFEDDGDP